MKTLNWIRRFLIDLQIMQIFRQQVQISILALKRCAIHLAYHLLNNKKMVNVSLVTLPLIFIVMIAEMYISTFKGLKLYKLRDTMANLALGLHSVVLGTLAKGVVIVVYSFFSQFSIFNLGYQWWAFVLCFFGSDFIYYLFHRLGHETQLFWTAHVTHHTSNEFNFSVALRQPFQDGHKFLFWIPLAVIGFDPLMIVLLNSLSTLYGFFLHTETVGKLGAIELLFNTPSHHRVHHSSNKKYLDKNYGRVLIIWDRFLGTFQKEEEKPRYGITKKVTTNNPFKLAFHEYGKTYSLLSNSTSVKQAFQYLFNSPGWKPEVKT